MERIERTVGEKGSRLVLQEGTRVSVPPEGVLLHKTLRTLVGSVHTKRTTVKGGPRRPQGLDVDESLVRPLLYRVFLRR